MMKSSYRQAWRSWELIIQKKIKYIYMQYELEKNGKLYFFKNKKKLYYSTRGRKEGQVDSIKRPQTTSLMSLWNKERRNKGERKKNG